MTPNILRTGASVAEKSGNPIAANQMRAAAVEIERLQSELTHANAMIEAAQEMMPAKPGLLRRAMEKRRIETHK